MQANHAPVSFVSSATATRSDLCCRRAEPRPSCPMESSLHFTPIMYSQNQTPMHVALTPNGAARRSSSNENDGRTAAGETILLMYLHQHMHIYTIGSLPKFSTLNYTPRTSPPNLAHAGDCDRITNPLIEPPNRPFYWPAAVAATDPAHQRPPLRPAAAQAPNAPAAAAPAVAAAGCPGSSGPARRNAAGRAWS